MRFSNRLGRIELQVETCWDFVMQRAALAAVAKGIGTINSPLVITPEAKEKYRVFYQSLAGELRAFHRSTGKSLGDADLFAEVHRRFGRQLIQHVCLPAGLNEGECIYLAIEFAKEPEPCLIV